MRTFAEEHLLVSAHLSGALLASPMRRAVAIIYLHIPDALWLSLLDLCRDPNRRLPHDRLVHTAVLQPPRVAKKRARSSG